MIPHARIVGIVGFFIDNPARIVGFFIDNACIYTPYSPALNVYPYF
jgi:hypothetical protein